jgi:hypothetical protein
MPQSAACHYFGLYKQAAMMQLQPTIPIIVGSQQTLVAMPRPQLQRCCNQSQKMLLFWALDEHQLGCHDQSCGNAAIGAKIVIIFCSRQVSRNAAANNSYYCWLSTNTSSNAMTSAAAMLQSEPKIVIILCSLQTPARMP